MPDIKFTSEEISIIEKNLGFIVFDWAKHLVTDTPLGLKPRGLRTAGEYVIFNL